MSSIPVRTVQVKKLVLDLAEALGNTAKICREYKVPRSTFYRWKKAYDNHGEEGLIRKKPIAKSHPRQLSPEIVEKILHLRKVYHFDPERITWYLERYHAVKTSRSSVYRTLIRHVYIKPHSPQLNGKVERFHRSDKEEFYQLLTYTDDVDLNKKLAEWEKFYNFERPHGAFNGKTPYEALRNML
ncbi:MAG: integrase core domain-containing protein [candidate division Zixibacteria bacterium]|nr:integrase core domain-containing protein [candidate division Zixibacteria bacterium]